MECTILVHVWDALLSYAAQFEGTQLVKSNELGAAPGSFFVVDRASGETVIVTTRTISHYKHSAVTHGTAEARDVAP